jgi:hypothetical protein
MTFGHWAIVRFCINTQSPRLPTSGRNRHSTAQESGHNSYVSSVACSPKPFLLIRFVNRYMAPTDNQSRFTISRRTALSAIGTVGSLGLTGCLQSVMGETSSVTVINNNNTSNTVSVDVVSDNGTIITNKTFDLNPKVSPTFEYTGNASKISVTVNGNRTKTVPFVSSSFSSCPLDKVEYNVVTLHKNGSISISTSCISET